MGNEFTDPNEGIESTLQKFLGSHKENYFIIGGHAAAYNLMLQGLSFRATRDYDIVIVSEIKDNSFSLDLTNMLESGGYKFAYKAGKSKRIAYRFESPSKPGYPEIIEFFVKEGVEPESIDHRFAKLNIAVDESRLSAMVLNQSIYDFSKKHVVEINGLMFVDKYCLIALKSFAYFENLKLYLDGKADSNDYKKHLRDVMRLLSSLSEDELESIKGLPSLLERSLIDIAPILTKSEIQLKQYGLSSKIVKRMIDVLTGKSKV